MLIHTFTDRDKLEDALLQQLLQIMQEAVQTKGECTILFSGGSTPKALMNKLAKQPIDWSKVQIGLVDDRMVSDQSPFSNQLLLKNELLNHIESGSLPTVTPLVTDHNDPIKNLSTAIHSMRKMAPIDISLLGMGTDGHFASIFPNDPLSLKAANDTESQDVYLTNAPAHPTDRITCSWPYIAKSKYLFLHITGDTKLNIINGSKEINLPINQVLEHNCAIFWAP